MSVTESSRKVKTDDEELEIRLSDIVVFLKNSRRAIIRWGAAFLVIGVIYALTQPNEFTSVVKVMPELKNPTGAGGLSDLKSLAGLAGVNLNNMSSSSEAIRPDLYPDIVQSIPFSMQLLRTPVQPITSPKPQSFEAFLSDQADNGIYGRISRLFSSDDDLPKQASTGATLRLTNRQEVLSKMINDRVRADMDKKSGIVTITSQMPDPVVAATVARQTLDYLTKYVTDYRTGKARSQAQFLAGQVQDARRRYENAELKLSSYRDRNRSLFLQTAKIQEDRLQADYTLAQTVFSELSKQYEQARIKVQEEAPVFQVLEPPRVPLRKSGPKRALLVVSFTLLGVVLGLIISFLRWNLFQKSTRPA